MKTFKEIFYENVTQKILEKPSFQKYMAKFIKDQNEKNYNKLIKYILCKIKNLSEYSDNQRILALFKIIYDSKIVFNSFLLTPDYNTYSNYIEQKNAYSPPVFEIEKEQVTLSNDFRFLFYYYNILNNIQDNLLKETNNNQDNLLKENESELLFVDGNTIFDLSIISKINSSVTLSMDGWNNIWMYNPQNISTCTGFFPSPDYSYYVYDNKSIDGSSSGLTAWTDNSTNSWTINNKKYSGNPTIYYGGMIQTNKDNISSTWINDPLNNSTNDGNEHGQNYTDWDNWTFTSTKYNYSTGVDTSQFYRNGTYGTFIGIDIKEGKYCNFGLHNRCDLTIKNFPVSTFAATAACKLPINDTQYIYPVLACNQTTIYYLFYTDEYHQAHYRTGYDNSYLLIYNTNIIIVGFTITDKYAYVSVKDSIGIISNDEIYYNYILQYEIQYTDISSEIPIKLSSEPVYTYVGYNYNSTQNYKFGTMGSLTSCYPDKSIYSYYTDETTLKQYILKLNPVQEFVKVNIRITYTGTTTLAIEGTDYIKATTDKYSNCICIINSKHQYDVAFDNYVKLKYYMVGGGGGGGVGYTNKNPDSDVDGTKTYACGGGGGGGGAIMTNIINLAPYKYLNVSLGNSGTVSNGNGSSSGTRAIQGGSSSISGYSISTINAVGGSPGSDGDSNSGGKGGKGGVGIFNGGEGAVGGKTDVFSEGGVPGYTILDTSTPIYIGGGGGGGGASSNIGSTFNYSLSEPGTYAGNGGGGGGGGGSGNAVNGSVLSAGGNGGLAYTNYNGINGYKGSVPFSGTSYTGPGGNGSFGGGGGGGGSGMVDQFESKFVIKNSSGYGGNGVLVLLF